MRINFKIINADVVIDENYVHTVPEIRNDEEGNIILILSMVHEVCRTLKVDVNKVYKTYKRSKHVFISNK